MGTSTNAILAFGFDLGEKGELPQTLLDLMEAHEGEIDEVLAEDLGIILPKYESGCDFKDYSKARDEALAPILIDLIKHCSGEYPMYFLAARGSDKTARRGSPTALDSYDLDDGKFGQEAVDAMRSFGERHGIEWQKPTWHIFSWWD